jgi:hypothetical protein
LHCASWPEGGTGKPVPLQGSSYLLPDFCPSRVLGWMPGRRDAVPYESLRKREPRGVTSPSFRSGETGWASPSPTGIIVPASGLLPHPSFRLHAGIHAHVSRNGGDGSGDYRRDGTGKPVPYGNHRTCFRTSLLVPCLLPVPVPFPVSYLPVSICNVNCKLYISPPLSTLHSPLSISPPLSSLHSPLLHSLPLPARM